MKEMEKESPQGQPTPKRKLLVGGSAALLLVAGQVLLFGGSVGLGLLLSVAAVALFAADLLLPSGWLKSLAPAAKPPQEIAVAVGKKATKAVAGTMVVPAPAPKAAFDPSMLSIRPFIAALMAWKPFAVDSIELPRFWMLTPLVPLLALAQWQLLNGKTTLPMVALAGAGLVVWAFLQNAGRRLLIPRLNENARALALAGLGLPVQLIGALTIWDYSHVILGFFIVVLGGGWSLYALGRWPIMLARPEEEVLPEGTDDLADDPPSPFFSKEVLQNKGLLLAASLVCAYLAVNVFATSSQGWSVSLGFLSIALLMGSFPWLPAPLAVVLGLPQRLQGLVSLGAGVLALALGWKGQSLIEANAVTAGLQWFLAAGVVGVLGFAPRPVEGLGEAPDAQLSRRFEITLFLLLVAAAFVFRAYKIGIFPYGAEGDEAGGGQYGMDVLTGNVENPLVTGNVPLHFFSVTALFYKLFGLSLWSMRAHSVVMGTLSVAATYFFFRLFCGWAAAFVGTLLMSFSYWHLHFSRFGHYNIEQVFMEVVAFYFVFKALRTLRHRYFVLGGLSFGLAMLPHLASRLLPFAGITFLIFLFLNQRPSLRRHASGLITFVLAAWVMASPALMYWFRATGVSFGRASSVSIFDKTNSNAPVDVLAGFVRNCKVSMLMFNYQGDSRSRDNPVAPEKILESGTAVLFALAFAYALYYWRQPGRFFVLALFLINLSASIFSVEAPQTLRTAGNIPLVFALITLWMGDLAGGMSKLGKRSGTVLFLLLLLPLAAFFSYRSFTKYWVERKNLGFDMYPTYVAMETGRMRDTKVKGILAATGFAVSHPPVMLFREKNEMTNYYDLAEFLPPTETPDKDLALYLVDDYQAALPYLHSLFPELKVQTIKNTSRQGGPPLASYVRVPAATLAKRQGLRARVLGGNGQWVEVANAPLNNSGPSFKNASRAEFKGALVLKNYGRYSFQSTGSGSARVKVDGMDFAPGQESLLAMGVHSFELVWNSAGDGKPWSMQWTRKPGAYGQVFNLNSPVTEEIPSRVLWQDTKPRGFYGHYYTSGDWKGGIVAETIDPVVFFHWLDGPVQGLYSVKMKARFRVDQPGAYSFRANVAAYAEVSVDGKLVNRVGTPFTPVLHPPAITDPIILGAGSHVVEMRFATRGAPQMELRWSGPGFKDELMQSESLEPLKD